MVTRMVDGFESAVIQCLGDNAVIAEDAVREQMYSGVDGNGEFLSPTYDDDPYFDEKGPWYHRNEGYKQWKYDITPPMHGVMLLLPPRPISVPNLFIDGTFHDSITAEVAGDILLVETSGSGEGADIVAKYGDNILKLSPTAIEYINNEYVGPCVARYFEDCGFKS